MAQLLTDPRNGQAVLLGQILGQCEHLRRVAKAGAADLARCFGLVRLLFVPVRWCAAVLAVVLGTGRAGVAGPSQNADQHSGYLTQGKTWCKRCKKRWSR